MIIDYFNSYDLGIDKKGKVWRINSLTTNKQYKKLIHIVSRKDAKYYDIKGNNK